MIVPGPATRIFLAPGATDLRRSFDGLHGLVQSQLAEDPQSGHLFLFCNKLRTRLKVLCFDGTGLWVCAKRLERGRFTWPAADAGRTVRLNAAELALLLGGLELTRVARQNWWRSE
jgi:transposase